MSGHGLATRFALVAALLAPLAAAAAGGGLEAELGRNEVRVYAAPVVVSVGDEVVAGELPARLEVAGYRRVHRRPRRPGEYFWGHERFWIHPRPTGAPRGRADGPWRLDLDRETSRVSRIRGPGGTARSLALPPALLAESLAEARAPRVAVDLDRLPEHVWRTVLAAEDARFFDHSGIDPRSVARAALANALAGEVVQGGSTITQQLVKVRDLRPKRTFGRKLSEAARALWLEAEHPKEEILEAYLDSVYLGHVGGLAVYGFGAAARAYFSRPAEELGLAEAALLAGMVQGPNRLTPLRHPEEAAARQGWVLGRMEELGWASRAGVAAARRTGLSTVAPSPPERSPASPQLLAWLRREAVAAAPKRMARGRGVVVETTLDPWAQELAEAAVEAGLAEVAAAAPRLAGAPLSAALVAVDARDGSVVAHVPGRPGAVEDAFDRVRDARRQPGSTVKPLVVLEALESCGRRAPLTVASRVSDRPLTLRLADGAWSPRNPGGTSSAVVTVRRALVESLNVPLVRVARWCGFAATARRFERAGLELPEEPPPAFVLGAVETSPLALAGAYTAFAGGGERVEPRLVARVRRPSGRSLERRRPRQRRVAGAASAYIVRALLAEAWSGEAGGAEGPFAKTGTSSGSRDAWVVGGVGSLVVAVWVGLDDGSPLGLSGRRAAGAIWRPFVERVAGRWVGTAAPRPRRVVAARIDGASGRRLGALQEGGREHLFRRGHLPPRDRLLRRDAPLAEVR